MVFATHLWLIREQLHSDESPGIHQMTSLCQSHSSLPRSVSQVSPIPPTEHWSSLDSNLLFHEEA